MAVNIKTLSQTYPITLFKDKPEPVWGDDAGRNSNSGKFSGTFKGYFTTLHIEIAPLTKAQNRWRLPYECLLARCGLCHLHSPQ